jgi:hypothetical protein
MHPAIDNLPVAEFMVNHFLNAKNMSAPEIHCALCVVCSQNVMSEGTIRQWCRMFKDG